MKEELQKLRINKEHKAQRHQRSIWPWVLIVLLLLGGGAYFKFRGTTSPALVQTLRVHAPESGAKPADMVVLNAAGYIIAAHKIEVASKVIGRVAWVGVEMGDKVKQGDVIVRLEDDEYKARVAQAQGQLDNAKARLAELKAGPRSQEIGQVQAQLDRATVEMENAHRGYQRLIERGLGNVSKSELDDAESLWKEREADVDNMKQQLDLIKAGTRSEQIAAQEATVAQIGAGLAQAKLDLDNTVIRAPIDSTILERNVEQGEFVTTGFVGDRGAKGYVVSIANLRDLLVELDIDQNNFAKVSMDQPCWITTDAYPDKKYEGKVELISPVANRQKATVQVRVRAVSPDDFLKPDMNASVAFLSRPGAAETQAAEKRPSIVIPADALREGAVFVVEDGHAVKRSVTRGMTTAGGEVEIKSGLIGGEDIILHPPETLKPGDPVATRDNQS